MSELVKKLIEENLVSKNPYLDLGRCGLNGTEPELKKLAECEHLETLILSDEWLEQDPEKKWFTDQTSQNSGGKNILQKIPDSLPKSLKKLIMRNEERGGIKDLSALVLLAQLEYLDLNNHQIEDITNLSKLSNLKVLRVGKNQIQDITPLQELKQLEYLNVNENQIQDISLLSGLENLRNIVLDDNPIQNLSPLFQLKHLEVIGLSKHQFTDISVFQNFKNLEGLWLEENEIEDISYLQNLAQLRMLGLNKNKIQDISPLQDLTQLELLRLADNQIADISPLKDLNKLNWLNLGQNQVEDISPLKDLQALLTLDLHSNQIQDISPLKDLQALLALDLHSNQIQDISPLKGLQALLTLNLHSNQIQNISPLKGLQALLTLDLHSNQIQDISPLKGLKKLDWLDLNSNQISDISPLKDLKKLNWLDLGQNQVEDISPLNDLQVLLTLHLHSNQIQNISPLKGLKKLNWLNLGQNQVEDISLLRNLPDLQNLFIYENPIQDFSVLENFIELTALGLSSCGIQDISFLKNLKKLDWLNLNQNKIEDISLLENLIHLQTLYLYNNQIQNISSLQNLNQLNEIILNDNQVQDISPLYALKQLQYIRLQGNQIQEITLDGFTSLLELELKKNPLKTVELSHCPSLQALDFSNLKLEKVVVKNLSHLASLNLNTNQIQDLSIEQLPQLKKLDVSQNQIVDISTLSQLPKLQELDLSENQIANFAPLSQFSQLEILELDDNKIQNISTLPPLPLLKELNLSTNQIVDISTLSQFPKLQELDLSENQIADFAPLSQFSQLELLRLDDNKIQDISTLPPLPLLKELNLSENQIKDFSPLSQFSQLEGLKLSDNKIQKVSVLPLLPQLTELDLSGNEIKSVTLDFLDELKSLRIISLEGNPIENIPREIYDKSFFNFFDRLLVLQDIKNYLKAPPKDEAEKYSYIYEGKMILIGNGEVGKSSIRIKLLDNQAPLPEEEDRTQGIDVATYTIEKLPTRITKLDKEIDFDLHIWDFGGQGRYREVQQLFCSRKSLYLFVTCPGDEPTKEGYVGFEYWLAMANAFSYDEENERYSPVIYILNKIDIEKRGINEQNLRDVFPNISEFIKISCNTLENFEQLEEGIIDVLPSVSKDIFKTPFPNSWLEVKQSLEAKQKAGETHILFKDYLILCEEKGIDESSADTLVRTLDRMGYLIYFGNNENLKDWIVLNPIWIKDAIYKVLDSPYIKESKFYPIFFPLVWSEYVYPKPWNQKSGAASTTPQKYTEEEHKKLLNLMLAYEFCYEQKDDNSEVCYVIPALFGEKPLDKIPPSLKEKDFDYKIKYVYDPFIPAGTVNKLTVRLHEYIYNDFKWKNGIILHDKDNLDHAAYAQVTENWEENTVYLSIKGKDKAPLYQRIYKTLKKLNHDLKDAKFLTKLDFKAFISYKGEWMGQSALENLKEEGFDFLFEPKSEQEDAQLVIGKALKFLEDAEYADYFKEMGKVDLKEHKNAYSNLRHQFVDGKNSTQFTQRLKVFTDEVKESLTDNKQKSSNEPSENKSPDSLRKRH